MVLVAVTMFVSGGFIVPMVITFVIMVVIAIFAVRRVRMSVHHGHFILC